MHQPTDPLAAGTPPASAASPASDQPPVKRRRLRKACVPCRQRKRKCDYLEPCEMCTKHGYACSYDANPGSTGSLLERSVWAGNEQMPSRPGQAASSVDSQYTPDPGSYRSLRSPTPDAVEQGILDPSKARYVSGSSIVAFPRLLAEELQSKSLPSLHSFAWNFGIRPEENAERHDPLHKLVSQGELQRYGTRYFQILQPIFDVLDQQTFHRRCREYYTSPENNTLYGSIIAGVVALGSFFSGGHGHKRETDIVQYAKRILEDPLFTRQPSVDMVCSWLLRTIYLRGTTRPNNAWLSSATTMNLAEATGLHRDPKTVTIVGADGNGPHNLDPEEQERRRRIFWCSWLLNTMISYEYGRSAVALPFITCQQINPAKGGSTYAGVKIAQCIPTLANAPGGNAASLSPKRSLCAAISNLMEIPGSKHPFTSLIRTDLALCFYRHLRNRQITIPEETVTQLIKIGHDTLEAASRLAKEQCLWWNVIGSIFQLVCVCISINNSASLALLGPAIRVLDEIVRIADTPLSREALMMARHLVEAATTKKKRELAMLEGAGISNPNESFKNIGQGQPQDLTAANMDYVNFNLDQILGDWNDLAGFSENPGFAGTQWVGQHTMPMLDAMGGAGGFQ